MDYSAADAATKLPLCQPELGDPDLLVRAGRAWGEVDRLPSTIVWTGPCFWPTPDIKNGESCLVRIALSRSCLTGEGADAHPNTRWVRKS